MAVLSHALTRELRLRRGDVVATLALNTDALFEVMLAASDAGALLPQCLFHLQSHHILNRCFMLLCFFQTYLWLYSEGAFLLLRCCIWEAVAGNGMQIRPALAIPASVLHLRHTNA